MTKTHTIECTSFLLDALIAYGAAESIWLQFPSVLLLAKIDAGDLLLFRTVTAEGEEAEARSRLYRFHECHHLQAPYHWESVLHLTPVLDFVLKEAPF